MSTNIGIASLVVTLGTAAAICAPAGHADPGQDQQYLDLVHSNGVAGQDESLIAFAQQFCSPNPPAFLDTVLPLFGQGVWPYQVYIVKVAASRVYCPNRIVVPPINY